MVVSMPNELDELPSSSLAARDYAQQQSNSDANLMLLQVVGELGARSAFRIHREMRQCRKGPGRINKLDYFTYRLYEKDEAQRQEFISDWMHWPIHKFCQDPEQSPITVDKSRCTETLLEAGIPTIPIRAVVDPVRGRYGNSRTITTDDDFRHFFQSSKLPLFAKPNSLLGSFGAFRIEGADAETLTINGDEQVVIDGALDGLMAGVPYVIQPVIENHEAVAEIASSLATIRTVNFVSSGEVRMAAAVLKLPVGGNIADNFWRSGNLLADVDPKTGILERVVAGTGPDQVEHSDHPNTGAQLVGRELPQWDEVQELNHRVAELFSGIRYQSQDIALTPDGPVVVEVNSGGSFVLPQVASGRGLLTEENKSFFESCGVDFSHLPKVGRL